MEPDGVIRKASTESVPLTTWTPTRRSSRDHNFAPELVGATPFWLASRFNQPDVMRLLLKHGANALVVHHVNYHHDEPVEPRTQATTAVMAAVKIANPLACFDICPRMELLDAAVDDRIPITTATTGFIARPCTQSARRRAAY
mgnify:CR=1 FL=1